MNQEQVKIKIIALDESQPHQLFEHYSSQSKPQDAYISLDLRDGNFTADVNREIGNAEPMDVWHGVVVRWYMPPLMAATANRLMGKIAPLAQRMLDGSEIEWDGSNYIGVMTRYTEEDIDGAIADAIEAAVEDAQYDFEICWKAGTDWYAEAVIDMLRPETTDAEIEEWMDDDETPVDFPAAVIDRDAITAWMRECRDELAAEAADS